MVLGCLQGRLAPRMGLPQGAAAGWHLGPQSAQTAGRIKNVKPDLKPACLNCHKCQLSANSNFLVAWALLLG